MSEIIIVALGVGAFFVGLMLCLCKISDKPTPPIDHPVGEDPHDQS